MREAHLSFVLAFSRIRASVLLGTCGGVLCLCLFLHWSFDSDLGQWVQTPFLSAMQKQKRHHLV